MVNFTLRGGLTEFAKRNNLGIVNTSYYLESRKGAWKKVDNFWIFALCRGFRQSVNHRKLRSSVVESNKVKQKGAKVWDSKKKPSLILC